MIAFGWAKALLCNSLSRYEEALAAAREVTDAQQEVGMPYWGSLVELVTAAARAGKPVYARDTFKRAHS